MAMFNSYVCLPEGRYHKQIPYIPYVSTPFKYHIYIYIYIPSINTIQRPYQQHHTSHGMNFPISQDTVQAKNDGENLAYQAQRHSTGDVGKPIGNVEENHGNLGKPQENHGKMGKSQENPWENGETHRKPHYLWIYKLTCTCRNAHCLRKDLRSFQSTRPQPFVLFYPI